MKRRFHFNWRVTLFSAVCLGLFIHLGIWQIQRAAEKQEMIDSRETLHAMQPIAAVELKGGHVPAGRRISFTGRFDESVILLLDNRVLNGRVGFEVHQLFREDSEQLFLVNRGFVPMGRSRSETPAIPSVSEGSVTFIGEVYDVAGTNVLLAQESPVAENFPVIVQQVDVQAWASLLNESLYPAVIRLGEDQVGALPRYWPDTVIPVAKHQGYAAQWFSMALAVLLVWLFFSFRKENEI